MIIISGKPGQLGNSLILYANFLAFGLENSVSVFNPSFHEYLGYFNLTSKKNKLLHRSLFHLLYYYTRLLAKMGSKNIICLDWKENMDLDDTLATENLKKNLFFVQGWQFRGHKLLQKYRKEILEYFTPVQKHKDLLHAFFQKHFSDKNETVIGLHIRRGDYSWFENGKYFYSISEYKNTIERTAKLFPGKNLHFLICSNEKINLNDLVIPGIKISSAPGHELLDMYSLSRCNYILGPPSTYTMWASFYGNVPLYMLHEIEKDFSLPDFKVQTHF